MGPDAASNPNQYTSRENDEVTGLYFYRARYYHQTAKIFLSEDPLGLEAGINFRSYVNGDPVSRVDPTGELPSALIGATIGAVMDISIQLMSNGGNLRCIKWDVVAIAAVAGAVNPFSGAKALGSALKAERQWARSKGLREGSRAAKRTAQRGDKHNRESWREGASWVGVEGTAEGLGNLIPDERHVRFGDPCECK